MRRSILALALLLTPTAWAAEPLTLQQALQEALGQNPTLATSELSVEQAEGSLVAARAVFDPRLSLSGNVSNDVSNQLFGGLVFDQTTSRTSGSSGVRGDLPTGTGYSVTGSAFSLSQSALDFSTGQPRDTQRTSPSVALGVSQQLLRGYRSAYNRRQIVEARNGLDVAALQRESQQQQTLAQVAQAYWTWANAQRLVEIAQERADVADEAARIGKLQLQEGRIAPVDEMRLRTEQVRARKAVVDATQTSKETSDALLLLLGRTPGADMEPATPMEAPIDEALDVSVAIERATAQNLQLQVATLQADQADLSHRMAKHGLLPSLTLDGSATFSQVTNKFDGQTTDPVPTRSLSGGATLDLPLGNHAARGEVQRASATLAQRQIALDEQRRQVAADAAKQVRVINAAAEQVRLADSEVELAELTVAAEEARANAGRAVQRDVLEARASLFNAKVAAAKARVDHQLAVVELLRLQGALSVDAF